MIPVRRPWTRQPQQGAQLDRRFPAPTLLHDGARGALIGPTPTNVSGVTIRPAGNALAFSHDGTSYLQFGAGFSTASFSVLVQFSATSTSVFTTLTQSDFGSDSNGSQQIRLTNSGGIDLIRDNEAAVLTSSAGVVGANRLHTALVSWDNSTGSGFIALDGAMIVSGSPGAQSWTTRNNFVAGRKRSNDTTESSAHVRTLLARWPFALSASIAAPLTANPWQLFAPRRIFVPVTGAATIPVLSAPTFVPGSLTSTGWRGRVTAT